MGLQVNCQTTLKNIKTVQFVKIGGDTMIQMSLDDAKIILNGLVKSEYNDSLLRIYEKRDSLNGNVIKLQKDEITLLSAKIDNQSKMIENFKGVMNNKDAQLFISKQIIDQQKREIKKQKRIKKLSLVANVVLPIVAVFAILGIN